MTITTDAVRKASTEIRAFVESGPTDLNTVNAQVDHIESLLTAIDEQPYDEKTSSTFGLLSAGLINARIALRQRKVAIEAGDYE